MKKKAETKKQPSSQQSIKPKILAEKSKTLEIPKTELEESSNLLYIIIGALALVVIILIMRKGGKKPVEKETAEETPTKELADLAPKVDEPPVEEAPVEADEALTEESEEILTENKPSKVTINNSSKITISIDGNAHTERLGDINIDSTLSLLSSAKEFWIVEAPKIKQFVQASAFIDDETCIEHWENGVECALNSDEIQSDGAHSRKEVYEYVRQFLISLGLNEQANVEKKEEEQQRRKDEMQKFSNILDNENELLLFSYALVNENSPLYTANRFGVDQSHRTTLKELYNKGWTITDIDKTGQSAQLEDFNFIVRVSK
ncbi:MAG: hypothetical protein HOB22_07295 [Candidatus Marinimicrobia bacterium]|nr:hypothetical protein [Candidatus Neomarinimicrobiota bacterium]